MLYDRDFPLTVTEKAHARLRRAAMTKPKVAFAGEFSAGKSTLLNLLLGRVVLPTQATATALPPVRMSYGDAPGHYMDVDGVRHPFGPEGLAGVPSDAQYAQIHLEAPILQRCDIIDLAGLADPDRSDQAAQRMLKSAHMAVWCTTATQAWRQSERAAWSSMPKRLHAGSLVAITRADMLRNDDDRIRVQRRVQRETEHLFSGLTLVSAPQAAAAIRQRDPAALKASGYHELLTQLYRRVDEVAARRLALLDRYVLPVTPDPDEARPSMDPPPRSRAHSASAGGSGPAADPAVAVAPVRPSTVDGPAAFGGDGFAAPVQLVQASAPALALAPEEADGDTPYGDGPGSAPEAVGPRTVPIRSFGAANAALRPVGIAAEAPAAPVIRHIPQPAEAEDEIEAEADVLGAVAAAIQADPAPAAAFAPVQEVPAVAAPALAVTIPGRADPELAEPAPLPVAKPAAPKVPRELMLWRQVVATSSQARAHVEVIRLIDRYLELLYQQDDEDDEDGV